MDERAIKCLRHIHFPLNPEDIPGGPADGVVIGSVFCDKCRIDRGLANWEAFIDRFRQSRNEAEIYVQQPFYLMDGMERHFLETLDRLRTKWKITGVLINSAGMALEISRMEKIGELRLVFSRFGIHKRRRTNRFLLEQLWRCGVRGLECFNTDFPLMEDILPSLDKNGQWELWVREGVNSFHSFSRACFVELYNGYCVDDPDNCASGRFTLNNDKKNINLTTSGHFIYSGPVTDKIGIPAGCAAIVTNIRENEL